MEIMVKCYGVKRTFKSRKAVREHFLPALYFSEGNERNRYINILSDLDLGLTYCDDRDGGV